MSRYSIPATDLKAVYYEFSSTLVLTAKGSSVPITTDIKFESVPWMGGLKYELTATIYRVMGPNREYEHVQEEPVSIQPWLKNVIIVTQNHPQGQLVPIHRVYINDAGTEVNGSAASSTKLEEVPESSSPALSLTPAIPLETILAGYRVPFKIQASASLPDPQGNISMKYVDTNLTLINSGIQGTNIFWQFLPIRLGETQVSVTYYGGLKPIAYGKQWSVQVVPINPPSGTASTEPSTQITIPATSGPQGAKNELPDPSIDQRIQIALRSALQKYPKAELFSVAGSTPDLKGVPVVNDLPDVTLRFRLPDHNSDTFTYTSHSFGMYFTSSIAGPWIGAANIEYPPLFQPEQADKIIKEKGYKENIRNFDLGKPLILPPSFDTYSFYFTNGQHASLPCLPQK